MDGVESPEGYLLGPNRTPEDVLAVADELLRSEGINPDWPGFKPARAQADEPR
jgi:hypothetical protein